MSLIPLKLRVPDLPTQFKGGGRDFSLPKTIESNSNMIREIKKNYGTIITYWGTIFNIPDGVLIAFIGTESGGKMTPPNQYKATGLMQVTPNALWECTRKWQSMVGIPLPEEARLVLNKQIPQIFTSKSSQPDTATQNKILNLLQKDASFNIMSGTLILRWLVNRFSTSITGGQLNKAMVAYNAGAYIKPLNISSTNPIKTPIDTLVLATNRLVPLESRSYLYKMLGKDGFLALIYQKKVI